MTFLPLLLAATIAPGFAAHHYQVRVDDTLTRLDVHACFADSLPLRMVADHALAYSSLVEAHMLLDGERHRIRPSDDGMHFPVPSDDHCLDWQIDLGKIATSKQMNIGSRQGDSLLLAPQTWLWRPSSLTRNRAIDIEFILPRGMDVSVPWQALDATPPFRNFRIQHTRFEWPAIMAIGKLESATLQINHSRLRLAVVDGPAKADLPLAVRWLGAAAHAVSTLHGRFPQADMQLLVIPLDNGIDAAPWAMVTRGGAPAVQFYMNTAADWSVFHDDWIATHELSHVVLPYIDRGDAWLSEGIASYYQHVLRARAGIISERQAWQLLERGMMQGRDGIDSRSLRDTSRSMRTAKEHMRVYWTGAAIALLADYRLRRETGNMWSLDAVLRQLRDCCLENDRAWTAQELIKHFDAISGTSVFTELYLEHVHSRFFPRLDVVYRELGIVANDGKVELEQQAAQAGLRRAIMSPAASVESTIRD